MLPSNLNIPPATQHLYTAQGMPSEHLITLLKELTVEHAGSWQSILNATQKEWLRPPDKECWQTEERFAQMRTPLLKLMRAVGILEKIAPTKKNCTYLLVLGAIMESVRIRLAYAIALRNSGVRFNTIVLLGGQRPLDQTIENSAIVLDRNNPQLPIKKNWQLRGNLPITEIEMMRMIYDQTQLPPGMENINVVFVDTPMQIDAQGNRRRPNTGDTINEWLKTNPPPGSCIAISDQPHVGYQDAVLRSLLPKEFELETVGPEAAAQETIATLLDALARTIYAIEKS